MKKTPEKDKNKKSLAILALIVFVIQLALSVFAAVQLIRADLLPALYTALIIILIAALLALTLFLVWRNCKRVRYIIGIVLSLVISAALAVSGSALGNLTGTLKTITDTTEETTRIGVYVRADDSAETISDAADYPFGIMGNILTEDTYNAIDQIEAELGTEISVTEYEGISAVADALLSGECDAMIISEDFVDMLTEVEGYEDFDSEIKEIASYEWTQVVSISSDDEEESGEEDDEDDDVSIVNEDVFIMYISGIDTYGSVSTKSRSDVNILAVVNTNTHQVLLISTPRDYYVELSISNGVKDKLTHAGIYGVSVSVDTLEMLYDTQIDYYFRINFTGFEELIDALGGITVYSEYSFTVGSYSYVKGYNTLDGTSALAFARERYSFSSGDRQRGKNQMAVIEGVINKLQTTAVLTNFSAILNGLEGSFETDMPYSELTALVKEQLSGGGSWDVVSYSVDGTGTYSTTYSMNQSLYVMVPDESTVETAKELINSVLANEIVSVD